jgi:Zn-dependent peptidase ImmA (M78 family)
VAKPIRVRYTRIARLVDNLLDKYRIKRPPIDIAAIAKGEGFQISAARLKNEISGFLMRTPHQFVIGVNKWHPETRQRFTIAHECGHALLHKLTDVHVDNVFKLRSPLSSQAVDVEEIEANTFAASILMPERLLRHELELDAIDIEDEKRIAALAKTYEVSQQSMSIRLVTLLSRSSDFANS